jgi:glycerophosphoryl diester phosphodiesterase
MRDKLNITAHSGCDGTKQDSLESVRAGILNGADAVEVDVRSNGEGALILSHDRDESRTYQGHASLADVFELAVRNKRIGVNCDLKERETVRAVLHLAEEMGMGPDQLILTGSSVPSMLAADPEIAEKAAVWLNIEGIGEDYYRTGAEVLKPFRHLITDSSSGDKLLRALAGHIDALIDPIITDCRRLGVRAVNMPFIEELTPFMPRFITGGLQVSVWTLNKRESLDQAFGLGVLNVTTRDTSLAVERRNAIRHQ